MRPASLRFIALSSLLLLLFASVGRANDFDKLTYFTFSGPVQVPGATLAAGTYEFRLANPGSGHNVGIVSSRNGKTVYAQFFMTPSLQRRHVDGDSLIVFRETKAGVPPAIRGWFYAGEEIGYEFMYSHRQLDTLTRLLPWPAPPVAASLNLNAMPVTAKPVAAKAR